MAILQPQEQHVACHTGLACTVRRDGLLQLSNMPGTASNSRLIFFHSKPQRPSGIAMMATTSSTKYCKLYRHALDTEKQVLPLKSCDCRLLSSPLQNTFWVIAFVKHVEVPVLRSFCLVAPPARVKHLHMISVIAIPRICWQNACHLKDGHCKH